MRSMVEGASAPGLAKHRRGPSALFPRRLAPRLALLRNDRTLSIINPSSSGMLNRGSWFAASSWVREISWMPSEHCSMSASILEIRVPPESTTSSAQRGL